MKVFVTGVTGQLGFDVFHEGSARGFEMIASKTDITDRKKIQSEILKIKPDVIVHCAAYTAVDKAELEQEKCWKVNVEGTKNIVDAASVVSAKLVYISTDYVYDGFKENPYVETDGTNPKSFYGKSKLQGENIVQALLSDYFILRTSWVFGENGNNFVKTMLNLANTKKELNIVGDQVGSPTYTYDLAKLIFDIITTNQYGIYHATNEGYCSWAEFAREIFLKTGKNNFVNEIPSTEYPTLATRPINARLSKMKLVENGFTPPRPWKEALEDFLYKL